MIGEQDYTQLGGDEPKRPSNQGKGSITRREYYWLLAVDKVSGRPVILGPFDTEEEGNRIGFSKIDSGNFEVIPLNTRNAQRANHILKYRRFNQTAKLEEALKRAKHSV